MFGGFRISSRTKTALEEKTVNYGLADEVGLAFLARTFNRKTLPFSAASRQQASSHTRCIKASLCGECTGSIIIDILLTVIDERHGCRKFFLLLASTRKKVSNEPTTTVAGSVMYRNEANE